MTTSTQLIDTVSSLLGLNRSTCANTYRELLAAGLVSKNGRGRSAAHMTSDDAALFLIALCGAESVKDTVPATRLYTALSCDGVSLVSAISDRIARGYAKGVQVTLYGPSPFACIDIAQGSRRFKYDFKSADKSRIKGLDKQRDRRKFIAVNCDLHVSKGFSAVTISKLWELTR